MLVSFRKLSLVAMLPAMTIMLDSCVDNDYDLDEDIDLTVAVGGTLTIPSSSTEDLTLAKILDLEPGSSIFPVEKDGDYGLRQGDYVLVQNGNSSPAEYKVDKVDIKNIKGSTTRTVLPPFINIGEVEVTNKVTDAHNDVNLSEDDITTELVSLTSAKTDISLVLKVNYISDDFFGTAYVKEGYTATFDESWTIEITDAATAQFLENTAHNVVRFKTDKAVTAGSPLIVKLHLTEVDFTKLPSDQGLYAPGKFRMDTKITSGGDVAIKGSDIGFGQQANLTIETSATVESATIDSMTGVVDPKIDVDPTSFTINDIPDFLSDNQNSLDISNPQIDFTVNNNSPLSIDVNGQLTAYIGGSESALVKIGQSYGTSAIIAPPMSTTTFVISRQPVNTAGIVNIVVPDLGDLIRTIPDEILFHDVSCKALPEAATFVLGHTYTFNADYEAVIPLAFGPDMHLVYTHDETDWDSDLEDYNFTEAEATVTVTNTIPLSMTPTVVALDRSGNELSNITATISGEVSSGTIGTPSVSDLTISLKSTAENMKELDGVRLSFTAKSGNISGVNLNKNQTLRFSDIKIKVIGGVIVDLN